MRVPDKPLPGDCVIRRREDHTGIRRVDVWVLTGWPDTETVIGGPYQSYGYALLQAHHRFRGLGERIWRDHARAGTREELEMVGDGQEK
jgi:hypothetical protein